MNLLILKTDIKTRKKVSIVKPALNNHPAITRWTVDTDDVDKVLRIEASGHVTESDIARLIKPYGFHCEDLPD